jgi:leader peptidase (prepilin peptidase)/N-methyltransferase
VLYEFGLTAIPLTAACVFLYAAWVDARTMEIPDRCHVILLGLSCIQMALGAETPFGLRCAGLFAIAAPMVLANLVRRDSFGGGDIKLCAAAGFFLGASAAVAGALLALLLAGIYGSVALMLKAKKAKDTFPLGPFLGIGFIAAMTAEILEAV